MERFGKAVVRCRYGILILALLLLIPSILGYRGTRINYDVLTYLPKDIETMKGQEILTNEFGTGALSMMVVEDMSLEEVSALKEEIVKIPHVKQALWYDSFLPLSVPVDVLPDKVKDAFLKDGATLLVITYDTGSSADETMDAVEAIRKTADEHCYLAGITGIVTDTRNLADREEPVYVLIAVLLALVVLSLTMDNFLAPILFLVSIGMAILYNLGSNVFFGEISYVTKALAAVLQLGVTMDYSIFLWHSYEENLEKIPGDRKQAMAAAITSTLQSVVGSSITTIAGFIALCFMSFALGLDIGLVMAKGVVLGVAGCVTILPSLILIFDKALQKMHHRPLLPKLSALPGFVAKHYKAILIVFAVIIFLTVPISVALSRSIEDTYQSTIQATIDMANEDAQEIQESQEQGLLESLIKSIKGGVSAFTKKFETTLTNMIEAVSVLIVTSCLIPLLVFVFFSWLIKMFFNLDVPSPLNLPIFDKNSKNPSIMM